MWALRPTAILDCYTCAAMETVEVWQGQFGDQYTERNVLNPEIRVNAFRAMLDGLNLNRVLEVGCNRGHNLAVLKSLYPDIELVGIEPNQQAREIANRDFPILAGDTRDLLFRSDCFDLAFTAGVLIHISLNGLARGYAGNCSREFGLHSRHRILC